MNYQEMKITPFYTPNTVFLSLQAYLAMYRDVFKYHWQYSQSKLLHNHEAIFAKVSRKLKTEASSFYVHCFLEWHWHPDATNLGISWACNVAHAFSEGTSSSRESASLTSFLTFLCVSPISMVDYLNSTILFTNLLFSFYTALLTNERLLKPPKNRFWYQVSSMSYHLRNMKFLMQNYHVIQLEFDNTLNTSSSSISSVVLLCLGYYNV